MINKRVRRILLILPFLLMVVGIAMLFMPSVAFSASVEPSLVPGNPECPDIDCCVVGSTAQYKIDPPANGTYTTPDGNHITISVVNKPGESDVLSFDWSSDKLVYCVISKGGPEGAYVYCYSASGGSYGDGGLVAPTDSGVSHIVFCYDPFDTTTTTEGTTTTTQGTTTTTSGTTTTTGGTTTTTSGTTTTTAAGTLEVLGIQELPFTGYDSLWYVLGAVLISLGILAGTFSLSTVLKRK